MNRDIFRTTADVDPLAATMRFEPLGADLDDEPITLRNGEDVGMSGEADPYRFHEGFERSPEYYAKDDRQLARMYDREHERRFDRHPAFLDPSDWQLLDKTGHAENPTLWERVKSVIVAAHKR